MGQDAGILDAVYDHMTWMMILKDADEEELGKKSNILVLWYFKIVKWCLLSWELSGHVRMTLYDREMLSALLPLCKGNPSLDSPHKGPVMCSFDFSFLVAWRSCWTNSGVVGDLRHSCDVTTKVKEYCLNHKNIFVVTHAQYRILFLCEIQNRTCWWSATHRHYSII